MRHCRTGGTATVDPVKLAASLDEPELAASSAATSPAAASAAASSAASSAEEEEAGGGRITITDLPGTSGGWWVGGKLLPKFTQLGNNPAPPPCPTEVGKWVGG